MFEWFYKNLNSDLGLQLSVFVWIAMFASLILFITMKRHEIVPVLAISTIIRLIFSIGIDPTLMLLGTLNVSFYSSLKPS